MFNVLLLGLMATGDVELSELVTAAAVAFPADRSMAMALPAEAAPLMENSSVLVPTLAVE